jgi:acyl-CoA ligase (AMP-forming) (exosortase A-associated)
MTFLLHHLVQQQALLRPDSPAVMQGEEVLSYAELNVALGITAQNLIYTGIEAGERVALWLPKSIENITTMLAISAAGGVMVPINPLLKPAQVIHILQDSGTRVLITQRSRLESLRHALPSLHDLRWIVLSDGIDGIERLPGFGLRALNESEPCPIKPFSLPTQVESDLAALLYTSGSTGQPKGVAVTHRNLLAGAESVADYLGLQANDRLLAVLPFSFDYGLSQLTTAFQVGACAVPLDYLLPRDLYKTITQQQITVLAGVPSLWHQLASQEWLPELTSLRLLTNSGGHLPRPIIERLRSALPAAALFLMYGLTEAFRSTYLPPEELDRRPDSIGKAIPNAHVRVLHPDGTPCAAHEPGELVHRGPTVARGYWQDPERSAERFRPASSSCGLHSINAAYEVWSGDRVRMDDDGFFYFISRDDDMLKTSGYRISPSEIEDVLYASGMVREAVVIGLDDEVLGQKIAAVVVVENAAMKNEAFDTEAMLKHCRAALPMYMVPLRIEVRDALPLTPNGKPDRRQLKTELSQQPSSSDMETA